MAISFQASESTGGGRAGILKTPHGTVNTPAFMAVGTRASVKGLPPFLLKEAGAQIVLVNAFHLALRPGAGRIANLGGIQDFMGWSGPVLSDSGGYQVLSLAGRRSVSEEGVRFRSPVDGAEIFLTPESAVEIQEQLGVDIAMALDELVPGTAGRDEIARATERTSRWAGRCVRARKDERTSLFGIIQGGPFADLREASIETLTGLPFDGFAAGGFSVGEDKDVFRSIAALTATMMPQNKPRYLMGMGTPLDLVEAASWGYDLFDCVLPTRNARNGGLFTSKGLVSIKNAAFTESDDPLDKGCSCWACRNVSRGYLNHLYRSNDPTGLVLNTLHNLTFYLGLMEEIREKIKKGDLPALREKVARNYPAKTAVSL